MSRAGGVAAVLGGLLGACFSPPMAAVMFACDPASNAADNCPDGYHCADDGCCHRDGTDDDEHVGACGPGGGTGSSTGATTATTSGISSSSADSGSGGTTAATSTSTGGSGGSSLANTSAAGSATRKPAPENRLARGRRPR